MMMDLIDVREKMEKALEFLADELATLKTGRATPSLVEKVKVEAYETKMPLVELATITAPEPNQLVVTPFDQTIIKDVERAIAIDKELKVSPRIDGNLIRIGIPPLTSERREEFVKLLNQKLEAGRVTIRRIRQDKRVEIKRAFEDSQISEDEKFRLEEELQELTDRFMEKIEKMGKQKEADLLSI